MGLVRQFWSWLTASSRRPLDKGHPDLNPLDVNQLAKELQLAEEGKRLGLAGLPAPDAETLSGPEAAVVQRVEKARQDYVDWAVLRFDILSREIGKRNVSQSVNRARQADKEFERRASALLSEHEGKLRSLGGNAVREMNELEAFRVQHGLRRTADYPTTTRRLLLFLLLFVEILFEGVFNAWAFAEGLTTGLIGGFLMAGLLAAINVGVAFAFGYSGVRYLRHRKLCFKLFGYLSCLAAFAAMTAIGLGIAHYRDALTSEAIEPAKFAYQTYMASPTRLSDLWSWMLFAVSILFAVFAILSGLAFDDNYPGYGAISRRTEQAINDHIEEMAEVRTELEALKELELKALDLALRESQAAVAGFETLIGDKRRASSRLSNALRDVDYSLRALLMKFRTENQVHRAGTVRPAYFDTTPELLKLDVPDFDTGADQHALAKQRELVEMLLAEAEQLRANIQASFSQEFDRLKPLDMHFPRNGDA